MYKQSGAFQRRAAGSNQLRWPFARGIGELPLLKAGKSTILGLKPPESGECRFMATTAGKHLWGLARIAMGSAALIALGFAAPAAAQQQNQSFGCGTANFTVSTGVTKLAIEAQGGTGGTGSVGAGGGPGGAGGHGALVRATFAVTPGQQFSLDVACAGKPPQPGSGRFQGGTGGLTGGAAFGGNGGSATGVTTTQAGQTISLILAGGGGGGGSGGISGGTVGGGGGDAGSPPQWGQDGIGSGGGGGGCPQCFGYGNGRNAVGGGSGGGGGGAGWQSGAAGAPGSGPAGGGGAGASLVDGSATNVTIGTSALTSGDGKVVISWTPPTPPPPLFVQRFDYTGQIQSFTVPSGVTSLNAIVVGASGGQTNLNIGPPGPGGIAVGTMAVQPAQVLSVIVGGNGNGANGKGGGGWGFGCGGARGTGGIGSFDGAGGGGGSAVFGTNLGSISVPCANMDQIGNDWPYIAAGGGGGGGGNSVPSHILGNLGGAGGAGGNPGSAGYWATADVVGAIGEGGCGGGNNQQYCSIGSGKHSGLPGVSTIDIYGGGGGGGGGGLLGGAGGNSGDIIPRQGQLPGGGGGGGLSGINQVSSSSAVYVNGGSGAPVSGAVSAAVQDGYVILTNQPVKAFSTAGNDGNGFQFEPPANMTQMQVHGEGGYGGHRLGFTPNFGFGPAKGRLGGPGGSVDGTLQIAPGATYIVALGLFGGPHGGNGFGVGGDRGGGDGTFGLDGGGGGGGTYLAYPPGEQQMQLWAGGGGGGGGNGSQGPGAGAGGAGCGGNGQGAPGSAGGDGGTGASNTDFPFENGGKGDSAALLSAAGGGGGGGAGGVYGGGGGHSGKAAAFQNSNGGGGGGAGDCAFAGPDASYGVGHAHDGYLIIIYNQDAAPMLHPIDGSIVQGRVEHLDSSKGESSVVIRGFFTPPEGLSIGQLDQATVSLTSLLTPVGGGNELSRRADNGAHLPITLGARPDTSRPDHGIYETAGDDSPDVSVEIDARKRKRIDFTISIAGAKVYKPASCTGGSSIELATGFDIRSGSDLVRVHVAGRWACLGDQLRAR